MACDVAVILCVWRLQLKAPPPQHLGLQGIQYLDAQAAKTLF